MLVSRIEKTIFLIGVIVNPRIGVLVGISCFILDEVLIVYGNATPLFQEEGLDVSYNR